MEIIRCDNISFSYRGSQGQGGVPVFSKLNFSVKRGEFVAILGHNGSGKSTLAKHFNAILLPKEGKVLSVGLDTGDGDNLFTIRSQVGMVFQNPDNQIVATIVEEDVAFGPENMGIDPLEIRRRVDEALKTVDMYEFRQHAPHQLSGGQKQRVAIAGVLAMQPNCIVLDEPTAMLDPQGRREVMATIQDLVENKGITVILITHFMDEAAKAHRVVVMDEGKFILDGTPKEVFSHVTTLKSVGLDVPQTSDLLYQLVQEGVKLPYLPMSLNETVDVISAQLDKKGVVKNDKN